MGDASANTTPFCPRLVTTDDRQYLACYDHDGRLVVAVRELDDGDWDRYRPGITIQKRDGHWSPALGIGPEGHVFIVYNTRNSPIRWRRSERSGDPSTFGDERIGMTGAAESSVTYPEFTRIGDDKLLFGYREGRSGNGDWILNRWDSTAETWTALQRPLFDGEAERNAYVWNLVSNGDETLQYFYVWREEADAKANTQLSYATSTDGGETWLRSDGTAYNLPITKETAEIVDDPGMGTDLNNQGWACVDDDGRPHLAYFRKDDAGNTQVYCTSLTGGSEWSTTQVTTRSSSLDIGGGGSLATGLGRPGIVAGERPHIVTRDIEQDNAPTLYTFENGT
jgi:hypothetical protein